MARRRDFSGRTDLPPLIQSDSAVVLEIVPAVAEIYHLDINAEPAQAMWQNPTLPWSDYPATFDQDLGAREMP